MKAWLSLLAIGMAGCGGGVVERGAAAMEVGSFARAGDTSAAVEARRREPESVVPAEPFSASWQSEAWDGDEPQPEAWVNADACPEPLASGGSEGFEPYEAFVDKALGLSTGPEQLAVVRIAPSFSPTRVLSVVRRPGGVYLLRSTRLATNVWAQMMVEMRALQGESFSLDEQSQVDALARVVTSKVVQERKIAASTAKLLVELWRSLLARAQVVQEVGIYTGKSDGTYYDLWYHGAGARTHSPAAGSVLGDVVSATEHLERVIAGTTGNATDEEEMARDLLQSSLERARKKEECLRRKTIQ